MIYNCECWNSSIFHLWNLLAKTGRNRAEANSWKKTVSCLCAIYTSYVLFTVPSMVLQSVLSTGYTEVSNSSGNFVNTLKRTKSVC